MNRKTRAARRILRKRRAVDRENYMAARHITHVARFGDDGIRCFDCEHVSMRPWEIQE